MALCAQLSFFLCQCSVLRVFKVKTTRIRRKSKQALESPRIEPETSSSEDSALTNTELCLLLQCNSKDSLVAIKRSCDTANIPDVDCLHVLQNNAIQYNFIRFQVLNRFSYANYITDSWNILSASFESYDIT